MYLFLNVFQKIFLGRLCVSQGERWEKLKGYEKETIIQNLVKVSSVENSEFQSN